MKKYSEEELKRLKSQIVNKINEIENEDLTIRKNNAKINELKELGAEESLYDNETRESSYAEARIGRWKELLKVDFEDAIDLLNLRIEELTEKSKEMSSYVGKTQVSRNVDIELKTNENAELDLKIKEIEEKKQKKLNLILNYQNMGDDDRADELKEGIKEFDKELDALNNKKSENQKIIELNNSKTDDVKDILKEIAKMKQEVKSAKGLAERYGIEIDIKEATKPEETKPEATKPEETKPEETKPEETKPEETKPEETKPEETKPEETKPEETKPEATKPEETKPEETKPEETKLEETKPEKTKPEETKPEETKPEATNSRTTIINEINISPEGIIVVGEDNNGEKISKNIDISDDKVYEILEAYNFKEGTEEYDRVDPNIVKALSNSSRQLIAYLKACSLKDDDTRFDKIVELSDELPAINYDLRGIRKSQDLDFEDKDYMYKQAKQTNKMFGDVYAMCTLDIGMLDRLSLFAGRTVNKIKRQAMLLKKNILGEKPKQKLLKEINENLSDKHAEFTKSLGVDKTVLMNDDKNTDIETLTVEQKAILQAEADKMNYTKSDGDVRDDL